MQCVTATPSPQQQTEVCFTSWKTMGRSPLFCMQFISKSLLHHGLECGMVKDFVVGPFYYCSARACYFTCATCSTDLRCGMQCLHSGFTARFWLISALSYKYVVLNGQEIMQRVSSKSQGGGEGGRGRFSIFLCVLEHSWLKWNHNKSRKKGLPINAQLVV